ncbi:hypothetical protein LCGC14_0534420 [marine sediment metagenome]|uniref:Uncharacterized protein n=1 Tax=marine sediment metagenome TaxID=412755 RepID=A0A0F9V2W7_9ZZZZ
MAAGKYILPDSYKEKLLEEVEGLSFYVIESTKLEYVIAVVDFLRKRDNWIISGSFCAFDYDNRKQYCQSMKNNSNRNILKHVVVGLSE